MHVVIVNDFAFVDGGASKIALGSARALAMSPIRVTLFSGVGPVAAELIEVLDLEVICLGLREIVDDPNRMRAMTRGLWNRTARLRMEQFLDGLDEPSRRETIIHVHTWTKALSASVIAAAIERGFRVVLTLHDYFSACPAGSFFLHPKQEICHLKPMSLACLSTNCDSRNYGIKLWRVGRTWMQTHPGRLPSGIRDFITISDLSQRVLMPFLPADARYHRVANFIDVEQQNQVDVAMNEVFSFAGRLSPEKGPLLLAECIRMLSVRDQSVEVQFIGDGPVRAQVAKAAPKAKITGWLKHVDVIERLRQSRALVLPSLWYETQGLVVAEAAALGVPAIVPTTSAAQEWVEDGVTGLLFEGGDATDLGRKICFLRDNPDAAAAIGSEAFRRFWMNPPSMAKHVSELLTVYLSLLAGHVSS